MWLLIAPQRMSFCRAGHRSMPALLVWRGPLRLIAAAIMCEAALVINGAVYIKAIKYIARLGVINHRRGRRRAALAALS